MASEAQIAANRANAQRSTGPRSEEGKARVAQNGLKHGLCSTRVLLPGEDGGLGIDAVWADDLHHQLRRLTAGDSEGYFASYSGAIEDVVTTLEKGWFYEGQRAEHFGKPRGTPRPPPWKTMVSGAV